jgi:hypothetical protein
MLDSVSLKNGDLVLRRGISIESYAVSLAEKTNDYSHIGMIVMESTKPFVIHIEPGESPEKNGPVKKESLASFLGADKASHFAIYRSILNQEKLKTVVARCKQFYFRKSRFDNAYNLQDDDWLYCTELVYKSFRNGDPGIDQMLQQLKKVNILITSKMILMPGAFTNSKFFYQLIKQ